MTKKANSKKRMGRPPVDSPANKSLGRVRVTEEQLSAYTEAAEVKQQSLSAWVRTHLDKSAKRDLKKS